MNEKLLIRLLSSPPNINYLKKYIENTENIYNFKYICSEFPLLVEDSYGYLDIFGESTINGKTSLAFFEAKIDQPQIWKIAEEECQYYRNALDRFDLLR
jgi:hypothetical protein